MNITHHNLSTVEGELLWRVPWLKEARLWPGSLFQSQFYLYFWFVSYVRKHIIFKMSIISHRTGFFVVVVVGGGVGGSSCKYFINQTLENCDVVSESERIILLFWWPSKTPHPGNRPGWCRPLKRRQSCWLYSSWSRILPRPLGTWTSL